MTGAPALESLRFAACAENAPDAAHRDVARRIAACAVRCLSLEIATWPKPGLVSHVDTGSHDDMDARTFAASAAAIEPYLAALARAGVDDADMPALRRIGLDAERAMLAATGGVNTHRGAIFGIGLLCAAAGWRDARGGPRERAESWSGARAKGKGGIDEVDWIDGIGVAADTAETRETLGALVARRWGAQILIGPRASDSHGARAERRHGAGGARHEAARGFPSVYRVGLPALAEAARVAPGDDEAARVHACFALIAAVDDTNLLHRGGPSGLAFAKRTAREFLAHGGVGVPDWRARAEAAHRAFVARRLSPGGAADLLAMSLFVAAHDGDDRYRGQDSCGSRLRRTPRSPQENEPRNPHSALSVDNRYVLLDCEAGR